MKPKLVPSIITLVLIAVFSFASKAQTDGNSSSFEKILNNYHNNYFNSANKYNRSVNYLSSTDFGTVTQSSEEFNFQNVDMNHYYGSAENLSITLSSTNPSTCGGAEGSITISGLTPGASYDITYTHDGTAEAVTSVADASGQITINGLKAGIYSNFELTTGGVVTDLNTALQLTNPIFIPHFNSIPPFCAGSPAPALPTTSLNGLNGTWNPSVIDNMNSGSYTFTPFGGQCGLTFTLNVTVIQKTVPTFAFGTSLNICAGGAVPALPTTSANGYTGTWSPSVVDNQNSGTYTFTVDPGQCATNATFTVTVTQNTTPVFSFGNALTICAGAGVPALPTTSNNGIPGTWSPSTVDNQNSGTYTFTPAANQCAPPYTFNVTVNPIVTPVFSFGPTLTICAGSAVPALPTTSNNGVTGTWNPASVDNQNSKTYTFTPGGGGQCSVPVSFSVTVTPNATPSFTFGTAFSMCAGSAAPALPTTSTNGITGTWSPSAIDNANSGTYTFTPDAGQCALTANLNVTVNPIVTPAFSFGTTMTACAGTAMPTLPAMSTNGIPGTWSPATVDNQNSGTYTFTPNAGQCASTATFTVTINPIVTPTFAFGSSLTICAGSAVPSLPSSSTNGINGTWNPATVDNMNSGTYTFTPTAGQCSPNVTFTVTVNPIITPAFAFGTSLSVCSGASVPSLPLSSTNGVTGTWSPSSIDNLNSGTYTFTPDPGQCANGTSLAVTVNPNVTPTFPLGTSMTLCQGSAVPTLSTTSSEGITGTWSPATVSNQNSATYTFTPTAGLCATTTTFDVTITPSTFSTFGFGSSLSICAGAAVPSLPTTSSNGYTGTWNPSTVDNQSSGVYTFTPDPVAGVCFVPFTFTVTVNPILTPTFSFGTNLAVCSGSTPPALPLVSQNGVTGTWSPTTIDNQNPGTYTFTTDPGQCATAGTTLTVTITQTPTVGSQRDTTVTDGSLVPSNSFSGTPAGVSFNWTNSNSGIGLSASGSGNVPSFTATNKGNSNIKGIVTVTPVFNGCSGTAQNYTITVIPLDKDVFVPNVFSPNGDGKNDFLYVYGNYISTLEMRIFNQWGQQVQLITDVHQGWDGRYNGTPQPVGVYVYTLKAVMTDGRTVQLKGSITLVR